jgi:hypothetical protein
MLQYLLCGLFVSLIAFSGCGVSVKAKPPRVLLKDASDDFFTGEIVHLHLTVKPKDAEKINRDGRPYVKCVLTEKNAAGSELAVYEDVAIKLKGAAGSFQNFDDKPALTVRLDKYEKNRTFHALTKFHLNNSVQDETYLHEQLCSELFTEAGVPATRVTHARVWLNTRDVGLYVLKEGFDHHFLRRHFGDGPAADGNLYDGGFCTDIDTELEKDSGDGPDDFSDLVALREACQTEDAALRFERLEARLDVDAFLTFTAMELMTCHWDGYVRNRNNYRLYFEPVQRKAYFFPHGMDQMFQDPGFSIVEIPEALVAKAVLENPRWREKFKAKVTELLPLFSPPDKLLARLDAMNERLRPTLAALDANLPAAHEERLNGLKEAIRARADNLELQKTFPPPAPVEFDEQGVLLLADWHPAAEVEDAALEVIDLPDNKHALKIACGPSGTCIASWRRTVLLARGQYKFLANLKTTDIQRLENDRGLGAGLRISGASRDNQRLGSSEWSEVAYEFNVEEESRDVELVAELRAIAGEALFDLESLRLVRKME